MLSKKRIQNGFSKQILGFQMHFTVIIEFGWLEYSRAKFNNVYMLYNSLSVLVFGYDKGK